ncbi:MAG TPA: deoxyguanosinetriphosphate triphosphohydrolase family protein [Dehalococcoidia bacterium]|nr:deoxyguanosinetriphosphate triphosphohydrolase family protein [Dehalococcoidia bacterium]
MAEFTVRQRLEEREEQLSPHAVRSRLSQGREVPEPPCPLRTEFQRDRDRIIHTKAFRRLKHKTQVFIAPVGDHYVTRLTHTLEVAQIGRTIARALNLNEDLVEAMCLGHDLGHTPFGHVGEETLDHLAPEGFAHARQSLRIVDRLEKDGQGLNLTWEVRQGIVSHSKPQGDFLSPRSTHGLAAGPVEAVPGILAGGKTSPPGQGNPRGEAISLEAQICRVADAVAYLNHDIADALRAGILQSSDLPDPVNRALGTTHSQRINALVTDIVQASWPASGEAGGPGLGEAPVITMSDPVREAMNLLREFMFQQVYLPLGRSQESATAQEVVTLLYHHLLDGPEQIPTVYFCHGESPQQAAVDYLAGMTDHYAIRLAERLRPGISRGAFAQVPLV